MNPLGFRVNELISQKERELAIAPIDFQHVLCTGATGSGKTASIILPTLLDRLTRGHTILFFDHKGHEHKKVKLLAQKAGRLEDVVEIGKPHGSYINLLAELDVNRLKEIVKEVGMKDPYWSNSAANLVEDLLTPLRKLYSILEIMNRYQSFSQSSHIYLKKLEGFGIDADSKISFQALSKIIASPHKLLKFRDIMGSIPDELKKFLESETLNNDEVANKRLVYAKILKFEESVYAAERFSISEDKSDTNTGNNAVLQTLDNTIASYAKRDYMNIDDKNMLSLMKDNAIIIIDTQSFGEDILKVFFESMLKKSVLRLRTGSSKPMSVFIDEANRVLTPDIDLHNDVLREASVEMILAIQNEEQMIQKFSEVSWQAIKKNIRHKYTIDRDHRIQYNSNDRHMQVSPLTPEELSLDRSEFYFYRLEKNRQNLERHFLGEIDTLPKQFQVIYDLDFFEHEGAVVIRDNTDREYTFSYFGEKLLDEVAESYPTLVEIDFSLEDTVENKQDASLFEWYEEDERNDFIIDWDEDEQDPRYDF